MPKASRGGDISLSPMEQIRQKKQNYSKKLSENIGGALAQAFCAVPREFFVAQHYRRYAYDDIIIPLAWGSYIERLSEQLAILAALRLDKGHRILEIGTGSGYSAALMAKIAARVLTIEHYVELAKSAAKRHKELGFNNIFCEQSSLQELLERGQTYDSIIIWPSLAKTPNFLFDLLAIGGRLITAIGNMQNKQDVTLFLRNERQLEKKILFSAYYTPLL